MKKAYLGKDGTSMFFALLLFLVLTVLGVNLLNAVNANILDTRKEIEKEQILLYVSSGFELVNQMITDGKFVKGTGLPVSKAEAVLNTKDEPMNIEILFQQKSNYLIADIYIKYQTSKYKISCRYAKIGSTGKYSLERCYGLEGIV